jgi:hypothetical protein
MAALSAQPPFVHRAAKVRFPPIVSNAALFTNGSYADKADLGGEYINGRFPKYEK